MYKHKLSRALLNLILQGHLNEKIDSKLDVLKNDFFIVGFCKNTKYFKTIHDKKDFEVTKYLNYIYFLRGIKPCFKDCFLELIDIFVEMRKEQLAREGSNGLFDFLLQVKMPYMYQGAYTNMCIYISYCENQNHKLVYLFMKPVVDTNIEIFKANILNNFKADSQADKSISRAFEKHGEALINKILTPSQKTIFIQLLNNQSCEEIAQFLSFTITRVSINIIKIQQKFTDFFGLKFFSIQEVVEYYKYCFLITVTKTKSNINEDDILVNTLTTPADIEVSKYIYACEDDTGSIVDIANM